jgi:hypothetical protein
MTNLETVTLITAIVGAACGSTGVILGIINTWQQISKNAVRLKVIPRMAFMIDSNNTMTMDRPTEMLDVFLSKKRPYRLCIEVINLSSFPVTVSDAGFGDIKKTRQFVFKPELSPGKTWPVRLDSREAVVIYFGFNTKLDVSLLKKKHAYVKTDCGIVKYGTSPIMKDYVKNLKNSIKQA